MMTRSISVRMLLACLLLAAIFTGCSRDPNVRKQKYFDSGENYFAQGKYHEAAIQFSNAIQVDPRFAQAHYELSQTYLKLDDKNRAFEELSRTVDLDQTNYRAHTDLANLLVGVRNPDGTPQADALKQAKVHLDILRDQQPNNPETRQAWANYYAAQNNLDAAITEMDKAIELDPNRSESYLQRALFELGKNLPQKAENDFKTATKADPKAMNAQLALGGFYQSRNRLPEAEQQFRHAIDVDAKSPAPREALVRLLMQEGKKDEAESFLRQTKKDLSDNPEGYRMLGDYYATNDLDKAPTEYASLYGDHPKDVKVKKNYIQLLILKNHFDEAAKLDDEILKANPRDGDALMFKGQMQFARKDSAGAVDALQSALRNDPDNAKAHYWLGNAFAQQHNEDQAKQEWREAVRLHPDLTDAQRALAGLALKHGDIETVLQTAQQIITAQPYAADGYILKGVADLAREHYSDAQQDAQQAQQRAPQNPASYVQMGNIQLIQKHYDQAAALYQQALDKDPSSGEGLSGMMNTYFAQKQYRQGNRGREGPNRQVPQQREFLRPARHRAVQRQERLPRRRRRVAQGHRTRQEQRRRPRKTRQGASPGRRIRQGSRSLPAIHQRQSPRGHLLHSFRRTL